MANVPEDSILRRHYQQLQESGGAGGGSNASSSQPSASSGTSDFSHSNRPPGFFARILGKMFGNK